MQGGIANMLQMVVNAGKDNEQVMELVDTPEFVLVQFCNLILRHRDIRNPDVRYRVQETINALKIKAERTPDPDDEPVTFNRYDLKNYIKDIEDLLKQFA